MVQSVQWFEKHSWASGLDFLGLLFGLGCGFGFIGDAALGAGVGLYLI